MARRKHKGNEIGDLKKALDFVDFEAERRENNKYGFFITNRELHEKFCQSKEDIKDELLIVVYLKLTFFDKLRNLKMILQEEINRLAM